MPWIVKHDGDVYQAAHIETDESCHEEQSFSDPEPRITRAPQLHMRAIILHAVNGSQTTMQDLTLHDDGPYEITWQEESWTP